ncbi:MAG: hypothetical protein WC374_11700 [Phycisphaerae bacterium]|jgi:hypothetical protein
MKPETQVKIGRRTAERNRMRYQFKLIEHIGLRPYEEKPQHWARFVLECSVYEEVIRIPVQVSVLDRIVSCWEKLGENNEEIMKRLYAFSRKEFEQYFQSRVKDDLDKLKEDVKDEKLIMSKIKSSEEANDKLDFSMNEEFAIEV